MLKELSNHRLLLHLILFCTFNLCLYLFMATQSFRVPFDRFDYLYSAHHFIPDPRISGGKFSFLSALAQYDAQWYLKIAAGGYSFSPGYQWVSEKSLMQNLTFAFFPLFPLLIKSFNLFLFHLELSAFIVTNLLLVTNFLSLYLLISRLYSPSLALKTSWLFFVFPFSIFYRSYYAENLQLLLLIWFCYFLIRKKFLPSAVFLGLLNITKGITLPLSLLFLFFLSYRLKQKIIRLPQAATCLVLAFLPLILWITFTFSVTHHPFYFLTVIQESWYGGPLPLPLPLYNLLGDP